MTEQSFPTTPIEWMGLGLEILSFKSKVLTTRFGDLTTYPIKLGNLTLNKWKHCRVTTEYFIAYKLDNLMLDK